MDFDPRDYDSRDEARSPDRDLESRDREFDPREAFTRDLNLPRSHERHLVHYRDHEYSLRGSESRSLAAVGAFRVVSSRDLRDHDGRSAELPVTALEKTPDIARFKAQYHKGRTLATVNRALGVLRAAVNWGRFQDPPLLST